MKTVKQEESISRSRFADCPVCKSHTLKLKRTVQVGRCKSCSETYKIIVIYVKTGRKTKPSAMSTKNQPESKTAVAPESSLPSWQLPSDSSLFGSSTENYLGLSDIGFGREGSDQNSGSESSTGQ